MHPESYAEMARLVTTYLVRPYLRDGQPLRIFDAGSFDINGTYRPLFDRPRWRYVGLDMTAGPNVDLVLPDPYHWPLRRWEADVVISGQAFEHIECFWLTWSEMVRVLRPGGTIFLIAPSRGVEHRYPVDCYRFYPDSYRALARLSGLDVLEVVTHWEAEWGEWGDTVGAFRKPVLHRRLEWHVQEMRKKIGASLPASLLHQLREQVRARVTRG